MSEVTLEPALIPAATLAHPEELKSTPVLSMTGTDKIYTTGTFGSGRLKAVRNATFQVHPGEVVALIGESGSGKSTIGKMVLHLISVDGGTMEVDGVDVTKLKGKALREYYTDVQGIFQDPFSSYNPIYKVDRVFDTIHKNYFPKLKDDEWLERVHETLRSVGMRPEDILGKFPHQCSGGQLQRVLIARALLLNPKLLVADEIISMLDASTRIDVLNLLVDLKHRGLGILFITHDLSLGNYVSDRVVILYKGRIVESGVTHEVFSDPMHPYTRDLLASVPHLDKTWEEVEALEAERTARLAGTCAYHSAKPDSPENSEELVEARPGHLVGCFRMGAEDPCPLAR